MSISQWKIYGIIFLVLPTVGQISGRSKRHGLPSLLPDGFHGLFPAVKRPGRENDHSPTLSVEIRYERNNGSAPPCALTSCWWTTLPSLCCLQLNASLQSIKQLNISGAPGNTVHSGYYALVLAQYLNVHQMLKHMVFSQKNAARKKKCMHMAETKKK